MAIPAVWLLTAQIIKEGPHVIRLLGKQAARQELWAGTTECGWPGRDYEWDFHVVADP